MDVARSIIFQMVIFYFISSYFRGNKTPPPETEGPDGKSLPLVAGVNLFSKGQELVSLRLVLLVLRMEPMPYFPMNLAHSFRTE